MTAVFIVAIVFAGIVLALLVIGGTFLLAIRSPSGGSGISSKDRQRLAEEARMVQEMYDGLSQLETRIEALETILMERQGKDRH